MSNDKAEEMYVETLCGECPDGIDWKAEYRALLQEMRTHQLDSYYRLQEALQLIDHGPDEEAAKQIFHWFESRLGNFGDDGWHGARLKKEEDERAGEHGTGTIDKET